MQSLEWKSSFNEKLCFLLSVVTAAVWQAVGEGEGEGREEGEGGREGEG